MASLFSGISRPFRSTGLFAYRFDHTLQPLKQRDILRHVLIEMKRQFSRKPGQKPFESHPQ